MSKKESVANQNLSTLLRVFLIFALFFSLAPIGIAKEKPLFKVLTFTKTAAFYHDAIPQAAAAIRKLGDENRFAVDVTNDSEAFIDSNLAKYDAVVFLLTTGDVLNDTQQAAFERYISAGHGYVGIHSASDTEHEWPWYGQLVGAYFKNHPLDPQFQKAEIHVEDPSHPSTSFLPKVWERTDEWYNFKSNPRDNAHVLLTLDESTYQGGEMGTDHPIAWCKPFSDGRSWYTGIGHTKESYSEPLVLQHILGGIQWAAGIKPGACEVTRK